MNHLKVFGSICHEHVPGDRRKKLVDKSEPMVLLGYHKTEAYMMFNLISGKLMINKDITIDENEA